MKAAILKTYGKKGERVVNMNYAAVDSGMEQVREVKVPSAWADIEVKPATVDPSLPDWIKKIQIPVNSMTGDSIPVSAFIDLPDGTMPQGTSKYEKRGIAFKVPVWDSSKCLQCNMCSYVCPHAVIRPFLLDEQEAANAPEGFQMMPARGKGLEGLQFSIQVATLDCTGCGSCVNCCPAKEKAISMQPLDEHKKDAENFEYAINLPVKNPLGVNTVKGSQFQQPLLEFPGACPGCGETPYAKLITQLFGDRMYVATATGCSQVWATSFPSFPYTKNAKGQGPAVGGSLFENNAEYGMGIWLSVEQQRQKLADNLQKLIDLTNNDRIREAGSEWLAQFNDKDGSRLAGEKLKAAVNAYIPVSEEEKAAVAVVKENYDHLAKKSIWFFGGDGWAYDIGYGGLDHVLASGVNVNVLVFDTEVYSNTGGQASKSTPTGAVAQFAAAGKRRKKKDLGMMAMSYGDVYVAQVALGANPNQFLKAVLEAEAYDGPSLIIAYAPCINHGLRCGMADVQGEIKRAVDVGYWQLYRNNPKLAEEGKNPFQLDSKKPEGNFRDYLMGETRYASLTRTFPEVAEELFARTEAEAMARYAKYEALAK